MRLRTRRSSRRQQQRDARLIAFAVVAAAGIGLAVMVVNWLLVHWWVLVVVLVLAVLAGAAGSTTGSSGSSGRRCGRRACATDCRSWTRCTTHGSRTRYGS